MIQANAIRMLALLALLVCGIAGLTHNASAQQDGAVPGDSLGINSDSDLWRFVRTGNAGSSQMKDELAAVMIQSEATIIAPFGTVRYRHMELLALWRLYFC